jgi:hypothetical protein
METEEPSAKELVVKAQYFLPIEPEEDNLRSIQNRLIDIMRQEGFRNRSAPSPLLPADRTMKFFRRPPPKKKSGWEKFKAKYLPGGNGHQDPFEDNFPEGLRDLRKDVPFRVVFRFKTFSGEDIEGYDLFVESTPVLLQRHHQLGLPEGYSYSVENIVDQNKREIQNILGHLELEPTQGPYTEAEKLETQLDEGTVEELEQHQYGRTAIKYINEGDQCLKQNLLHAALSCYIQGIEWTILYYKIAEEDTDLIEQQQSGETGYLDFINLVDKVKSNNTVSQKTVSKLNNINESERRWMAHHKSGQLERQDVENVRTTLLRLTDELL